EALQAELGPSTRFARTDVSREHDVAASVDLAVSAFGRLDVMFNNAGILGAVGPLVDTTDIAWHRTLGVLLDGVFFGMKHAARVMIPQRAGAIISTASIAGITGGVGPHAYTACKHAVVGLTKSVSSELGQYGIRVNAIAPGNTVTAMTAAAITGNPDDIEQATKKIASTSPLGIPGLPSDIANAALYLASDESRYVSGHTLVVDAG
ncbi:MAG: SDR family oxidoreductase, partial [Ilumatobacteraceae bacterium]